MLVDRLAYHLAVNGIQNGGFEAFFPERYYDDDNALYKFIKATPEYKDAQAIVRHWMKKVEEDE